MLDADWWVKDRAKTHADERNAKVDLVFAGVPLMLVGPYSTLRQYYYLAPEWTLKGLGLARIYKQAALLIPEEGWSAFHDGKKKKLNLSEETERGLGYFAIRGDRIDARVWPA